MSYKFRAIDIETDDWVTGDLAYVQMFRSNRVKPYIVTHRAVGGMLYITDRHQIHESTIELLEI